MDMIGRWVKVWLLVSLCSLLVWAFHFFPFSYERFFNVLQGNYDAYVSHVGLAYWTGHVGLNTLFLAALLGMVSLGLYTFRGVSKWTKRFAAVALALYASYFALELPFIPYMLSPSTTFFAYSYALQALFTVPFMLILAFKIWTYQSENKPSFWMWGGLAFFGFAVALWANVVMRWFDMISISGIQFLMTGIIGVGFLGSAVLMSLAVISSIVAAVFCLKRKPASAFKWMGMSLILVGSHYVVYTVYSYFANVLSMVLLVDVWTVPFLGLGIAMLFQNNRKRQN